MTAAAPSSNPNDANPPLLRSSYREAASAYLAQNERLVKEPSSCQLESATCERGPCGSPPRYRPNSSRCRSRSPPQPSSRDVDDESTSCPKSKKAPRSVSPGGTAATSAGAALRGHQAEDAQQGPKPRRRVNWSHTLVASVRTRPRTLRKDVASLFYSRADEKRFRREAEFAPVEDDWCEDLDQANQPPADNHKPLWSPTRDRKDYGISQAVVVFGDSTRTYGDILPGGCALEAALEAQASTGFSFDDSAFWNGQLTWS